MKRATFFVFTAILAAGLIFSSKASFGADDKPAADKAKSAAPAKPARVGIRLGFGPDGRISKEKFLADNATDDPKRKAALEKLFAVLDANHDGFVTMAEIQAAARRAGPAGPPKATAPDDEPTAEPQMPAVSPEAANNAADCDYAVVISDVTAGKPEWKAVADALVKKHDAKLVVYKGSVVNCLPELAKLHPRYTAFVARPEIVGRQFVARIHRLTRHLGDEPYTGTIWGIVSGATPDAALRVATATGPEVVHSVISNTGVNSGRFDTVFTLSDGKPGDWYYKDRDGKEKRGHDGDADRTELFVDKFKEIKPDAIVTSGHATEMNLEMPFSKGNTEAHNGKWCGIVNWRRPTPRNRSSKSRRTIIRGSSSAPATASSATSTRAPSRWRPRSSATTASTSSSATPCRRGTARAAGARLASGSISADATAWPRRGSSTTRSSPTS